MKVGIITITQGTNFGNRLQIYALQTVLKRLGYEPYLVLNNSGVSGTVHKLKYVVKYILDHDQTRKRNRRDRAFRAFDNKYLSVYGECADENYLQSTLAESFGAFVCGSDQVWNPNIPYLNGVCFADFPGEFKRIAYSVSFGVETIPESRRDEYQKWINKFDAISVREFAGSRIVHSLVGKTPEVLIDPTLMLDSTQWTEVEEEPPFRVPEQFILTYFLGSVTNEMRADVDAIQDVYQCSVLDVSPDIGNDHFVLNPSHFIYLIHHAQYIITDSYHATIFSLLFGKPVKVVKRNDHNISMESRFDTILALLNIGSLNELETISKDSKFDFYQSFGLNAKREAAISYLIRSLGEIT